MSIRSTILAYLTVLNHGPTINSLSETDFQTGVSNRQGCLEKIQAALAERKEFDILAQVKIREKSNQEVPVSRPDDLAHATQVVSESLLNLLQRI